MKIMKLSFGLLVCLLTTALAVVQPSSAAQAPAPSVGRIAHMEGELLRYVPEVKDWVATVPDAPFGVGDTLFSGNNGMAELIVPNGIWIRTGSGTQIQFIRLDADLAEADVASGTVRFYGKGKAAARVTSDFGYVLADPGTIFDLYVGDNAVEVVAIKGTVSFVHAAGNTRYEAVAGAASILADRRQVSLGNGTVDPEWNRWNMDRENVWLARDSVKGPSAEYLPPDLRNDAYSLEENGTWERVPYEGQERWFWRPTVVAVDWSPFTVGRWTEWYGDQTWIPAEPFGYVTHHYGNWIFVRNRWYWAPPVVGVHVGLPLLNIGFFWYPGRVAWIHSGIHVGWVPLAPRETYYCRRPWGGPHTVVVNKTNINRITINVRSHAYVDHAVIVDRSQFHGRDDYRKARVPQIDRAAIVKQYRAAPLVNAKVLQNQAQDRQRFAFTSAPVSEKPHATVTSRIRLNEKTIREGRKETAPVIQKRLKELPEGRISRDARVDQPRGASPIVPAGQMNRPKGELTFPQREIKGGQRSLPAAGPGQTAKPADRPTPAGPTAPAGPQTERAAPAKPAQPSQPAQPTRPSERGDTPARPPQAAQPAAPSGPAERTATPTRPSQPAQPARPAGPSERATPARPAQPVQTPPGAERVTPAQTPPAPATAGSGQVSPQQPAQPPKSADRATPARPAPPTQPPSDARRVAPGQPAPTAPPATAAPGATLPVPAPSTPARPKTERAAPAQPAEPAQPAQPTRPAERGVTPARPPQAAQPAAPSGPTERTATPTRPSQPDQPARPAERVVAPSRPAQPAQERVAPVQPSQPAQPARPSERATPARPSQTAPAAQQPERAAPAPPAQPQAKPEQTPPQPEPKEKRPGHR